MQRKTHLPNNRLHHGERITPRPSLPAFYRQVLAHDGAGCTGCGVCGAICIEQAITVIDESSQHTWSWSGECSLCGLCIHACPNSLLHLEPFSGETMQAGVAHACGGRVCCRCGRVFRLQGVGAAMARLGIEVTLGANWLEKLCDGCRAREIAGRLDYGITG